MVDTEGKQLHVRPMSGGYFVLLDSAGKQVRDADGAPIVADVIINGRLEHADGTAVLDDEGKILSPWNPIDVGKLRASSIAAEEAKEDARRKEPYQNRELTWSDGKASGKVTTTDGRMLTVSRIGTVLLNGKPLYTSGGPPIRNYGGKTFWRGGQYVKYPDGRVVDRSQPIDIPALVGTAPVKRAAGQQPRQVVQTVVEETITPVEETVTYVEPVEYHETRVVPGKRTIKERRTAPSRAGS